MSKKKKHGNFNNNGGIISKRRVQKPTVGKAKAVRLEALSKNGNRYVIIDDKSGEILDDAQGYGYRSVEKAYAGYRYQVDDKARKRRNKAQQDVRAFLKKHKDVGRELDDMAFYAMKDCGESIKVADIRTLFKAKGIDEKQLPFTLTQFKNAWFRM